MSDVNVLGNLPEWDLDDLYPGQDAPELEADLKGATEDAEAFSKDYKGKLAGLNGAGLAAAIADYERIEETLGRIMSYAGLVHAANSIRICRNGRMRLARNCCSSPWS